jgi:hypothetical protein
MKRSKSELKYRRDMKRAGWKLDYDGPGSSTWSKPVSRADKMAMAKASIEGDKIRAKLAKKWLIDFIIWIGFCILLNAVLLGGALGKIPSPIQIAIAIASFVSIILQIFDRKNKIGLL